MFKVMDTPYGEIPDKYAKSMRPQEMHDYLKRQFSRRTVIKGAVAAGAIVAAGPLFWRKADAFAAGTDTTTTPQWIAYGPDPGTTMWVSWSAGSSSAGPTLVPTETTAVLQYATDSSDLTNNDGQLVYASLIGQVPVPSSSLYGAQPTSNVDDTYYISAYLDGLTPDTTYYYKVSLNGGSTWNSSAHFTTGKSSVQNFTFCATGDENENSDTANVVASILAYNPDFTIVAGDLSYASGGVETLAKPYGQTDVTSQAGYTPSDWDAFFSYIGESAQYIPWIVGVGNHEMEPLTVDGYAGVLTRFPDLAQIANGGSNTAQNGSDLTYTGPTFSWNGYTTTNGTKYNTGSPVVRTFVYGNVAFIQLDGNDLSAEISYNNGYTNGLQTSWLIAQLATYRESETVDFIVVYFHNCPYCSNTTHGSDAGVRNVWQPIFDNWNVDLVINGHVHAYERSNPLYNNAVVKAVTSGGSYTNFYTEQGALTPPSGTISATTYICAGGGGNSLYTDWYGVSGVDGPASDETSDSNVAANEFETTDAPFVDVWEVGGEVESGTATGAPAGASGEYSGGPTVNDPAYNADAPFSAFRFATWSHLAVNVIAPTTPGGQTSMQILSVDANVSPTVVQDSVTIVRTSVIQPPAALSQVSQPALLVATGAAVVGGAAYLRHRKSTADLTA
jgi:hypothetical protein